MDANPPFPLAFHQLNSPTQQRLFPPFPSLFLPHPIHPERLSLFFCLVPFRFSLVYFPSNGTCSRGSFTFSNNRPPLASIVLSVLAYNPKIKKKRKEKKKARPRQLYASRDQDTEVNRGKEGYTACLRTLRTIFSLSKRTTSLFFFSFFFFEWHDKATVF